MESVIFSECDKYELNNLNYSDLELRTIEKHVKENFGKDGISRNLYFAVENKRFAHVGVKDEEISFGTASMNKHPDYVSYDRTLNVMDNNGKNSKVLFGFDGLLMKNKDNFVPMPFKKTNKKKKK